jgi:glutathione peroxidase
MTIKQKILKTVYPLFMLFQKLKGQASILQNRDDAKPGKPFHSMRFELTNGKEISLENFRGKKILIVNTASDCGYTAQFTELQKLYQHSKEDLEIIAFPSNQFKQQEKANDQDIEKFCVSSFSIRFLLAKKINVRKGEGQHEIFEWLTDSRQNGWNNKQPSWNFAKYLVNEEGILTHYFDPAISPLSEAVIGAVHG